MRKAAYKQDGVHKETKKQNKTRGMATNLKDRETKSVTFERLIGLTAANPRA
jgi:hypothetical protein